MITYYLQPKLWSHLLNNEQGSNINIDIAVTIGCNLNKPVLSGAPFTNMV